MRVAVSLLFAALCAATPLQVHIALTGSPDSMMVSWFSREQTDSSAVKFGTSSGNYISTVYGTSRSYNKTVGWTHDVTLTGLSPATSYFYVAGEDASGWSREYTFRTSRNADERVPTSIGAVVPMYGDMGATNSNATARRLIDLVHDADFYFHVGDISYADDVVSGLFEATWDAWFDEMKPLLPYTPYMVSPGNHEHDAHNPDMPYTEYFTVYNYRFRMPFEQSGSTTNTSMWYSFNYGGVHWVSISSETDYENSPYTDVFGDQLDWLTKDLEAASANRKNVPWIVVVGHRPLYSSANTTYVQNALKPMQDFVEKLFHDNGVDLYVCGHVHSYERSYPMYKGQPTSKDYKNPTGLVQVISGSAGCIEPLQPLTEKNPWSGHTYDTGYGYGVVNITQTSNGHSLAWTFYRSDDNGVEDYFEITKS